MSKKIVFIISYLIIGQFLLFACGESSESKSKSTLSKARNLMLSGRYLEAKEKYELYLQRNKQGQKRWEAWNRILFINSKLDATVQRKIDILETIYMEFSEDNQKIRKILPLLAQTYGEELGQNVKAENFWKNYLKLCAKDFDCRLDGYLGLAQTYFRRSDFSSARDILYNCLDRAQNKKDKQRCQYPLARSFILQGNTQKAINWLQKITDSETDNDVYSKAVFELADLYNKQKKYFKAKKLLQSILDKHPNPKLVQVKLSHIEKEMQN